MEQGKQPVDLAQKDQDQAELVECEACGKKFKPEDGYHEEGEYTYCADCCCW